MKLITKTYYLGLMQYGVNGEEEYIKVTWWFLGIPIWSRTYLAVEYNYESID